MATTPKTKTITSSTPQELMMYLILFLGALSILVLFATNILLVDRVMTNLYYENQILKSMMESQTRSVQEETIEESDLDFYEQFDEFGDVVEPENPEFEIIDDEEIQAEEGEPIVVDPTFSEM